VSRIAARGPSIARLASRLSRSDLLWVANTSHGPGGHWHARVRGDEPDHDHLASPDAALRYLADHGVPVPAGAPDDRALEALAIVRRQVRSLLVPDADPWTAEARALLAGATFRIDAGGRIASTDAGWRGFCHDLLVPLLGLVGDRGELRSCANPACRLLFDDESRNHARRWCDTKGCGNRDRGRRARGRRTVMATDASGSPSATSR
jgi:hypothetical protein